MNIALLLSGGTGTRLGADIPKQYIEVGGRPIISYCLERLAECGSIDAIWVVADEMWYDLIRKENQSKLKGFSEPGATRQLSILNGLEGIKQNVGDADIVIIHDAARPLVSVALLERVIAAVEGHDGSMPVLKMKDTVYYSTDGYKIDSLLDRSCLYAGQAPEAFWFEKYYEANKSLSKTEMLKINGSTEPAILAGLDVVMVEGEEENFKITTGEDLGRFRQLIEN